MDDIEKENERVISTANKALSLLHEAKCKLIDINQLKFPGISVPIALILPVISSLAYFIQFETAKVEQRRKKCQE